MRIDATAGTYGLFQVVFADLADHLAYATFTLRKINQPGLAFEEIFKLEFSNLLKQFRAELARFDHDSAGSDSLRILHDACGKISEIALWRNERIHARVRMTEQGYALYDWRTRKRLEISQALIEENIQIAVGAIVALESEIPHLVRSSDWEKQLEEECRKLLAKLPELR